MGKKERLWLLIAGVLCLALTGLLGYLQWIDPQLSMPAPVQLEAELDDTAAIVPVPRPQGLDPRKVKLGKLLFNDPRLSSDDTVSCATCHPLDRGGADGLPRSVGVGGQVGLVNAPTVLNAGLNFRQFWDGRAASLEEQINGPVNNPVEMASSWEQLLGKLQADPDYRRLFAQSYPDGITAAAVRDAIATFERALNTPNSPFDRYLLGDTNALDLNARRGYRLFVDFGCISCHQGANVGGNLYARFGIIEDSLDQHKDAEGPDLGRFNLTGNPEDRFLFKVPSLRNVELTAPYFHNASAATLEEAIRVMGVNQLGLEICEMEQRLIAAFLRSLTGELDGDLP